MRRFGAVKLATTWLGVVALLCLASTGCQSNRSTTVRQPKGTAFTTAAREEVFAARLQAMAAADTYVSIIAQAHDELRARTKRPEVDEWAMDQRIACATASFTNATGPNGYVALLDMMVMATLKRCAVEEHWIPTLLHEEGEPLLDAYNRGEREVWDMGDKVLSQKQLVELKQLVQEWRKTHPEQYYVGYIRFTDFVHGMKITDASAHNGSVLGLVYDPLAGLDPVAREMQEYRALTERLNFFVQRLPVITSWQVERAVHRTTHDPQVGRFVDNTSKFADATTRFSAAVAKFPQDLSAERVAAIRQIETATTRQVNAALDRSFAGIDQQRKDLSKDLEGHQVRLDKTVGNVQGVVDRAKEAGQAINTATQQTVDRAETGTRRTIVLVFWLAAALIVFTLICRLLYRIAVRRWAQPPPAATADEAAKPQPVDIAVV